MLFKGVDANRFLSYSRFIAQLPRYFKNPLTLDQAQKEIQNRLKIRTENFLSILNHAVYENPTSPYNFLLNLAGCEYGDLVNGVGQFGLEPMLQQLMEAGVWISLDEFKGRKPIQRGDAVFQTTPNNFNNPFMARGIGVSTGGTTGRSVKTRFDLGFMAARACYDRVMMDMLDLEDVPIALWYPTLPASTGIANILRYAKSGFISDRWYNMLVDQNTHLSLETRMATATIIRLSRWLGQKLPFPEPLPFDQIDCIVDQLVKWLRTKKRCAFQSYVSQAVRVAGASWELHHDLKGLVTIVGSEPLTPIKKREIEKTGAEVYNRYMATEIGTIGMGCGNPSESDEIHLMSDMVAMIQAKDTRPKERNPLFFSSLHPVMPKILINVQLGDSASAYGRACGCEFEKLGFHTHLSMVRSDERFTTHGMAVPCLALEQSVDDVLVAKYGGTSMDYQWVEAENRQGQNRLKLRVSPDIGLVDEKQIVIDVLNELQKGGEGERLMSEIWRQADVISVIREFPKPTGRGKMIPVLKEST